MPYHYSYNHWLSTTTFVWDLQTECEAHSIGVEVMGLPSLAIDPACPSAGRADSSSTAIQQLVQYCHVCRHLTLELY